MPDDKKLTFSAQLDAKPSPGMERAIKKYGQMVQAASNMDHMFKNMDKWMRKDKELAKVLRDGSNKALKEKDALLASINQRVEKSTKLYRDAEQIADRWLTKKKAQLTQRYGDVAPHLSTWADLPGRRNAMASNLQGRALQDIQMGTALAMDREEQRRAEYQRNVTRLMAAGMMTQVAGNVISGIGDLAYGRSMKSLAYENQQGGFAGRLYNEIVSGDFSSVYAMGGKNLDRLREIVSDSAMRTKMNLGGGIVSGVGQTAVGVAQGAVALEGGGLGSLSAPGAVQNISGGTLGIWRNAQDWNLGLPQAEQASNALQAISYLKTLDPVRFRQFQELMGRRGGIHRIGALTGQSGPEGYLGIARSSMAGGLTADEGLPYWEQLRRGMSTSSADILLGTASQSLDRMGIDRGAATTAMVGFGQGLAGGGNTAGAALEGVMRRAVAGGLKDSAIKEALATTITQFAQTSMGRGKSIDAVSAAIVAETNAIAARAGRAGFAETADVAIAAGGMAGLNQLTGGGSGITPLDVRMQWSKIDAFRKAGLSGSTLVAGARLNVNDILNRTSAFTDLTGNKAEDIRSSLLSAIPGNISGIMPGASKEAQAALLAPYVGGYEQAKAALGMAPGLGGGGAVGEDMGGVKPGSSQMKFTEANISGAAAQMSAITKALTDPDMLKNMQGVAAGAVELAHAMERMNADQLRKVPALLNAAAEALLKVGVAAGIIAHVQPDELPTVSAPGGGEADAAGNYYLGNGRRR